MHVLAQIDGWPVDNAAAGVIEPGVPTTVRGANDRPFALASVTKVLVTLAVLVAVEEGSLDLSDAAGPSGSTIAHLLAHASGLGPDSDVPLAPPGARRIYSNRGFEVLADRLEAATGITMSRYLDEAVVEPLGLASTKLAGSAAHGAVSSVDDLCVIVHESLAPTLVSLDTMRTATTVAFPGLDGVLPGYGRQSPNDWGLGFEVRGMKHPHWTGSLNSPATFGHFGQAGTMMWIDPVARVGFVALTDRPFGSWATTAWPALSDAVLVETRVEPSDS